MRRNALSAIAAAIFPLSIFAVGCTASGANSLATEQTADTTTVSSSLRSIPQDAELKESERTSTATSTANSPMKSSPVGEPPLQSGQSGLDDSRYPTNPSPESSLPTTTDDGGQNNEDKPVQPADPFLPPGADNGSESSTTESSSTKSSTATETTSSVKLPKPSKPISVLPSEPKLDWGTEPTEQSQPDNSSQSAPQHPALPGGGKWGLGSNQTETPASAQPTSDSAQASDSANSDAPDSDEGSNEQEANEQASQQPSAETPTSSVKPTTR